MWGEGEGEGRGGRGGGRGREGRGRGGGICTYNKAGRISQNMHAVAYTQSGNPAQHEEVKGQFLLADY